MTKVLDDNYLAITAIVTAVYQFTFFLIAAGFKFDKVTDFAGSTNFVVLALLTAILKGTWHPRQIVVTLLVVAWGLRLAVFLLLRILRWGEDRRFDQTRSQVGKFAVFWTLQAVWVWTVSLPVTVQNASSRAPGVGARDIAGWALYALGLAFEVVADQQKLRFKEDPGNKNRWCDAGVWRWSRHPNYFGEILLWWGIFVASTPVLRGGQWAVVAGPVFITLVLLFLSGIPMLEQSADKKHGGSAEYRDYKNRTSVLFPFPPALFQRLPGWVKATLFLEFPLYSKKLSAGEEQLRTSSA